MIIITIIINKSSNKTLFTSTSVILILFVLQGNYSAQ